MTSPGPLKNRDQFGLDNRVDRSSFFVRTPRLSMFAWRKHNLLKPIFNHQQWSTFFGGQGQAPCRDFAVPKADPPVVTSTGNLHSLLPRQTDQQVGHKPSAGGWQFSRSKLRSPSDSRFVTIPSTPSDHQTLQNFCRNILRQDHHKMMENFRPRYNP